MTPLRFSFFAAAVLALAALPFPEDGDRRCSPAPFASERDPQMTYLLGVATPDTVYAGQGPVEPGDGPGHWGGGGERRIYGQVIRVERFGGADSATLAREPELTENRKVVIVPWDYDESCRPAIWSRSARWVPLEQPGMYTVRPRPRSDWADGIPTFDARAADIEPYPLSILYQRGYWSNDTMRTEPSLTAAEYLELYRALPDAEMIRDDPEGAADLVDGWEQANPALAATYPAPVVLLRVRAGIRSRLTRRHLDSIVPPLAGTYRLTVLSPGEQERTFYARTLARPSSALAEEGRQQDTDLRQAPSRPDGYSLLATGALTPDSLPPDCRQSRRMHREGHIAVVDPPLQPGEVREEWVGEIEVNLLARQFPTDSALIQFARAQWDEIFRRNQAVRSRELSARFTRLPDGTLRVEQTIVLEDGRALVIRGERISPETIACF